MSAEGEHMASQISVHIQVSAYELFLSRYPLDQPQAGFDYLPLVKELVGCLGPEKRKRSHSIKNSMS